MARLHSGKDVEIYSSRDWPYVQYLGQELAQHQKLQADLSIPS